MNWLYRLFNDKMNGGKEKELPFKPGSIVSVVHERFSDPVISIVQETDENYIYLAYPNEFKGSGIKTGDSLLCRLQNGNTEYVIYSRINNINLFYPMYLHLYVENIVMYESKRRSKRYLVDYDAFFIAPDTDENIMLTAKNISASGLFVSAAKRNIKGFGSRQEVSLRLVTNENESVFFGAKIVRTLSRGRFVEFGLKITDIDEKSKSVYERVINKLDDELGSLVLSYIMSVNSPE